jgi:chemotaxis protein methyltransferase CheR
MTATSIPADAITFVCTMVRDRAAIELEASKSYLIEARLAPLARKFGFATAADLIQGMRAKSQPDIERSLVEAMTTNETSFFRDVHPFDTLKLKILPDLKASNSGSRQLNIWSAACSTGQEIYSIAMILRESFPELLAWSLRLYATDLSNEVLSRARTGRFSQVEVNRGLPAQLLSKYFRRDGLHWQLSPEVISMVTFNQLNFIEKWPVMPSFEVVFLRNVLIYFSPETKRQILQNIRKVMAPNAVLFLGAAETTMGLDAMFERERTGNSVCYRVK